MRWIKNFTIAAACLATLLSGDDVSAKPAIETLNSRFASRVFLRPDCPIQRRSEASATSEPGFTGVGGVIAPIIGPIVGNFIISAIKAAIEQHKQDLLSAYTAVGAGSIYPMASKPGQPLSRCLILARGTFGELAPGAKPVCASGACKRGNLDLDVLKKSGLDLVDFPDLYAEIWIDPSLDEKKDPIPYQFVLEPRFLHFFKRASKATDAKYKHLTFVFALTKLPLGPQDSDVEDSGVIYVPMGFDKVVEGTEIIATKQANPLADQTRLVQFTMQNNDSPWRGPLNLVAFVNETEEVSPMYDVLKESIEGGRQALIDAITDALDGSSNGSN